MAEEGNAVTLPAATAAPELAAEVRVVRCPKCKKLLPELVGVNVYRCGGCNAALQASKSAAVMVMEKTLEKPDDVRIDATEITGTLSSPEEDSSNACIQADQEGPKDEMGRHLSGIPERDGNSSINTSRMYSNISMVPNDEDISNRYFSGADGNHYHGGAQHHHPSEDPANGPYLNMDEKIMADTEGSRVSKMQGNRIQAGQKFYQSSVQKCHVEDGTFGPLRELSSSSSQGVRFSPYPGDGPIYKQGSNSHHHVDHGKYSNTELPDRVEHLEKDRAELLKKLDELRDQLTRSCEIKNEQTGKAGMEMRAVPTDHYECHGSNDRFHVGPSSFQGSSMLNNLSSSDGHSLQQYPMASRDDLNVQRYHSSLHKKDDIYALREPFGSLPSRKTPCHLPYQFPERPPNSYGCGHYDSESVMPHPCDAFYNKTIHSNSFNMPSRIPSTAVVNRTSYLTNCHECHHVDDPPIGSTGSYSRANATFFPSSQPPVQQRSILKQQNGQWCYPLGGGAPFLVCSNCFQLMQVPRRLLLRDKHQHKLRCGSCSHIMSFEVNRNRIVISDTTNKMNTVPEPINNASDAMADVLGQRIYRNGGSFVYPEEDFSDPIYNTHYADEKFILSSPSQNVSRHEMMEREYGSNSSGSENTEGIPFCLGESKNGGADPIICHRGTNRSAELPRRSDMYTRGGSVPLREHFGCSSRDHFGSRSETGSRSARSEQDKLSSLNGNFKQNSVKDVLMATEMDCTADEYPNQDMSQDSTEACEDELPRTSKGGESFLTGLIKKGFSRSNQSFENGKVKLSVNGHRIPDRLVRKAEKQAGPIQPGEYWYDYRAGFWGVMGQQCLGIILPFIEEFNYPMPKNCSSGNTGVVVNGRELHQKDLELLAGRGLPTSRDGSYIIEISGRVLDAVTGEELECLGKLAPTVEKVKHGFGMWVPCAAAV